MIGNRLHIAKKIAKKRFKKWYPDEPFDKNNKDDLSNMGILKKTNVRCSKECCCNPRHSIFLNNQEKLTMQERKHNEAWAV